MSSSAMRPADSQALNVGYLVETPITREKKMYGAQLSFVSLVSELRTRGVVPFVVVSEEWELTEVLRSRGVSVLTTPIWEFFRSLDGVYADVHDPAWVAEQERLSEAKVVQYFTDNSVDLVHMNTRFAGLLGARVARRLGLPYIYHIREFLAEDFGLAFKDEAVAQDLVGGANALVAISQSVQEHLIHDYPGSTVEVIYNGVDVDKYSYDAPARLQATPVRIALVGRVVEHKGQLEAVKAIETLRDTLGIPVELHIVGYRPDELTPYEQLLIDYVRERALEQTVKFIPFTSEVPELLRNFDIGLMCSSKEAFGRVTVEYMLSRLLVIGSATGGTAELIADGEDGLLYTPGDHRDLARQLARAIADPAKTNRMIEAAYDKATSQFTASLNAQQVRQLYDRFSRQEESAEAISS